MADLILDGIKIENGISIHTNLDSRFGSWKFPDVFRAIPNVGDYIDNEEHRLTHVCYRTFKLDGSIELEVTGRSYHP